MIPIHVSIQKGLEFLKTQQQSDGSFLTLSSPSYDSATHAISFHSTFTTSLILDCLHHIPAVLVRNHIIEKSVNFLHEQKNNQWTWNYWARGSKEEKTLPYPDDLDDTSCALVALYKSNPSAFNGSELAHFVTILTQLEIKVGGPYRTWIVPDTVDDIWKDVDLAVNANIGYFLSLFDISLPALEKFIETSIKKNTLSSPYYASIFPILFFVARWYKGKHTALLIKRITTYQLGECWGTDIQTALAISALMYLGYDMTALKRPIEFLQTSQKKDGSWEWGAFYTGVNPNKDTSYYAGSQALTTAFCIQALSQYQEIITTIPNTRTTSSMSTYTNTVITRVNQRISTWSPQGYQKINPLLLRLTQGKTGEQLVLLPYYFWESLDPVLKKRIKKPEELLMTLSCATLYGWIAYTIYDNILDNEGNPEELSVANLCLRELTYIFTHAITHVDTENSFEKQTAFNSLFTRVMDNVDNANQWEVVYAHIPTSIILDSIIIPKYNELSIVTHSAGKFKQNIPSAPPLSARSLGHALAPICLLVSVGLDPKGNTVNAIEHFFHCYLTARQLNDDAHDWEEDLRQGRINCVGSYILQQSNTLKKYASKNLLQLANCHHLKTLFWETLIPHVSQKVLQVCDEGEAAIEHTPDIVYQHFYKEMMKGQREIAKQTLSQQEQVQQFLRVIQ